MDDEQGEEFEDDIGETRLCLFTSLLLLGYLCFKLLQLHAEIVSERIHRIDQCALVAMHKLGTIGRWDDDRETCMIRMRFESNLGPVPSFYEQEVPVDQTPPGF